MRDVNVPKKEIDDLLEELIGAWNWDALTNTESSNVDVASTSTKKHKSDISEDQLNTPPISTTPATVLKKMPSYEFETSSIPLMEPTNDSLTKPLSVDTRIPPEPSLIISNQSIVNPLDIKQPKENDMLLIAKSSPCKSKAKKPKIKERVQPPIRRYLYESYVEKYKRLRELQPINEEFGEVIVGFTKKQIAVLEHQLRIYTQFAIQHFIQTFSHPRFWEKATKFKTDLEDMQEVVNTSMVNVCNLEGALDFVERWEKDLSEVNEENKKHIEFIESQMARGRYGTRYILRFPPKIMQAILTEESFLYPEFVPKVSFRTDHCAVTDFAPSELM